MIALERQPEPHGMSVTISDDLLQTAGMMEEELKRELAVLLFQKKKLTVGQASHLAGMNQLEFQLLLAERQIPVHYGVPELEEDIERLRGLGRL